MWVRLEKETLAQPFPDLFDTWAKTKILPTEELNEGLMKIDEILGNALMEMTKMVLDAHKVTTDLKKPK